MEGGRYDKTIFIKLFQVDDIKEAVRSLGGKIRALNPEPQVHNIFSALCKPNHCQLRLINAIS